MLAGLSPGANFLNLAAYRCVKYWVESIDAQVSDNFESNETNVSF